MRRGSGQRSVSRRGDGFDRALASIGADGTLQEPQPSPKPTHSRSPGTSGHIRLATHVYLFPDQERKIQRGASSGGWEGREEERGGNQCWS